MGPKVFALKKIIICKSRDGFAIKSGWKPKLELKIPDLILLGM